MCNTFHNYGIQIKTGFIHRAISQSGNGHCLWTLTRPGLAKKKATKVAELLGCPSKDSKQLVDCLRKKKATDIIATDRAFQVSSIILFLVIFHYKISINRYIILNNILYKYKIIED